MEKYTQKEKSKKWLSILLFAAIILNVSSTRACTGTANFTYTLGPNGYVTFKSTSTNLPASPSYQWNPGDGNPIVYGDTTYAHSYTANGTYTVSLILSADSSTCSDTARIAITISNVTAPCMLSASFTDTVNASGMANFTSSSTGTNSGTQYYWNPGDGSPTVLGTNIFTHTYIYAGGYNATLSLRDTGTSFCLDSITNYLYVSTADSNVCHLHANFTYSIGLNGNVTFTNTSTSISGTPNAHWNFGDGNSDSTSNINYNHAFIANGNYKVVLMVEANDSMSCSDTISHTITISNVSAFPCTLSAGFTTVNDTTTGQVQFINTSTGTNSGTQYYWRTSPSSTVDSLAGPHFAHTYGANGTFPAWLIVRDTGTAFCVDSIMEMVNVSNVDSLHASFVVGNTQWNDTSYIYTFVSTSTGTNNLTTYAWNPGDSTASDTGVNLTTYTHGYLYPGLHTVTLSLWFTSYPRINHKNEQSSAPKYDLTTFSEVINVTSGIPTVAGENTIFKLYPDPSDGLFRLSLNGIEHTGNAEVQISNLLGEVVYQTTISSGNGAIVKDINLKNISNGTYFVRVITANKVYNSKIVISK
ncbi:MAG: PKD domain-containing protein [Bacteroidia bacterium]